MTHYRDYDQLAALYNAHWGGFGVRILPVLEQLILTEAGESAHIVDVCCGTGQLAAELIRRGYRVTGIDGSPEMLRYARQNAPQGEFIAIDVRAFTSEPMYDAAVCAYDSLNHLMTLDDLKAALSAIYGGLVPGGRLVFDLNMEAGYQVRWCGSFGIVEDQRVTVVRSSWHAAHRIGEMHFTILHDDHGSWQRSDFTLTQRCYSEDEVRDALESTGFQHIRDYDAEKDFGWRGSAGRTFFTAAKL